MEGLPEFFRDHQVQLVASMPCYLEENVCAQRGRGVYERSIEAIKRLNGLGYGSKSGLPLNLVYNPGGPFLPPPQLDLEKDYRRELGQRFGVAFTRLLTITNMPLGRFRAELIRKKEEENYLQLLRKSFNPQTVTGLMCRHQISVGWDGTLYDCDFNLALALPVNHGAPRPHTIFQTVGSKDAPCGYRRTLLCLHRGIRVVLRRSAGMNCPPIRDSTLAPGNREGGALSEIIDGFKRI